MKIKKHRINLHFKSNNTFHKLFFISQTIQTLDRSEIPCQALVRVLAQKPGFKDNNFQVLKLRLEALKTLAENSDFTR